ncbi:MAG TPA: protoporphyrinogen oxidase [Acidobacteriaceae bacterium]|nr:protoporphyrinogen oxidase [Acidobacteriaceae bacterium]
MKRIAIIGGGLSGLSAAYQLKRDTQTEFTIFEATSRLGGIIETIHQEGFTIECGPDSWVTEKPWARELAIELGLGSEIIPSNDHHRRTYILRDNQLVPMPDGLRMMVPSRLSAIRNSPLFTEVARLAYQREPDRAAELKASALPDDEDESVASFVRRHFGDEVTRTLAGPLLAGVFGGDIESLSVRAVMPAFVKMERDFGSLILAVEARAHHSTGSVFTNLRSGLGTFIDRIAALLPPGSIRLSTPVTALARTSQGWHLTTSSAAQTFDSIIIAAPAPTTRSLLHNIDARFDPLLAMDSTSAIIVAFAFLPRQARALSIPRGFGYLAPPSPGPSPEADSQLLACTFVDQKFSHRVPQGGVLLRAFFGGAAAQIQLHQSDNALAALAHQRLSEVLGPLPAPHITIVRRLPHSLPQYAIGHLQRMARLESLVKEFPGLHLAGNAYYGVGLPDMVRIGRTAARAAES